MFSIESLSDVLGYTSILFWLGAQFPQIVENVKQQSCESLALPFLFNWMLGDVSNLIGCILTHQLPFQTYLATYFCFIDFCLLCQYFYYGGGPKLPPVTYPYTRSRTASSAGRLSFDASHYRTVAATTAALAARSDTYPEHRRPKKPSFDEHSVTPLPSEEPLDEACDAVPSNLSESFYSESGQTKRVSWSQERHEQPSGGSVRRHVSPAVPTMLRHTPAAAAALAARGRPPRREAEGEAEVLPEEQDAETERRNASRASRRSLGMVMLGIGMLFGVGRYIDNTRVIGRGAHTGEVLVPTSDLDLSTLAGLPPSENQVHRHTDLFPSLVSVELPVLPSDALFSRQQESHEGTYKDPIVGRVFAWICTTLYLTSRLPQIWKNYVRKSVEGLSIYLFIFAFLGNLFYVLSIVTSHEALLPPPASTEFYRESLPYLLGSGGTFVFDMTIVAQAFVYRGKHPRRGYIRSRGNSLVRSAAHAEETAGLLRGDALAATRARAGSASVPRS